MAVSADITVRRGAPADARALAEIYCASARQHVALDPTRYRVPALAAVIERFTEVLAATERAAVLVAESGGVLTGYAELWAAPDPVAASMMAPLRVASATLAVAEEARERGIGTALLDAARAWAGERGGTRLVVDVLIANERALRFYERQGFRRFGALLELTVGGDRDWGARR